MEEEVVSALSRVKSCYDEYKATQQDNLKARARDGRQAHKVVRAVVGLRRLFSWY